MNEAAQPKDVAIRAITNDGAFRVITVRTTDLCQEATLIQKVVGPEAELLVDLMTGSALVRQTMSPDQRVELVLDTATGKIIADSRPSGHTRSVVQRWEGVPAIRVDDHALFRVVRRMPRSAPHESITQVQGQNISASIMTYMHESEQIMSVILVGSIVRDRIVVASGGYIVQLLPECTHEVLEALTTHLEGFQDLQEWLLAGADAQSLMDGIVKPFASTWLETCDLQFGCDGCEARALAAIVSLSAEEVGELVMKGETVPVHCDFCGTTHQFSTEQLRTISDRQ